MLGEYSKRPRLIMRDDLPRFIPFNYVQINATDNACTAAPPVKRFSLPYQVLPSGRILASELLKIEFNWSANYFVTTGAEGSNFNILRRFVVDALQSPYSLGTGLAAVDTSTAPDWLTMPYESPSVLKVFDRHLACNSQNLTSAGITFDTLSNSLHEEYDFGCCGSYPIVPSGSLSIWGFWLAQAAAASSLIGTAPASMLNVNPGYANIFMRPQDNPVNSSHGSDTYNSGNPNPQPYVSGRIWFRTVELTPYQHIMIVQKYTNKVGTSSDETYVPPQSPNPQRSNGSNITPWFGS